MCERGLKERRRDRKKEVTKKKERKKDIVGLPVKVMVLLMVPGYFVHQSTQKRRGEK